MLWKALTKIIEVVMPLVVATTPFRYSRILNSKAATARKSLALMLTMPMRPRRPMPGITIMVHSSASCLTQEPPPSVRFPGAHKGGSMVFVK